MFHKETKNVNKSGDENLAGKQWIRLAKDRNRMVIFRETSAQQARSRLQRFRNT